MSRNQIRAGQLITTFGPGAMVDLPEDSVIIAGLDEWVYRPDTLCLVQEPRLAAKAAKILRYNVPDYKGVSVELRLPPPAVELLFEKGETTPGVDGKVFPLWYIVQKVELSPAKLRRRRLVMDGQLSRGRYRDSDGKSCSVVPMRFVRACSRGHVGDINWREFVHKGPTLCQEDLWMEERGSTADLSDTYIVCECGATRGMNEATEKGALGKCDGNRPWLSDSEGVCTELNRLLVRTASNAYFPQMLSVISIPDSMSKIEEVVLELWAGYLCKVTSLEGLVALRGMVPVLNTRLEGLADGDVYRVIERIKSGESLGGTARPVKEIEIEALSKETASKGKLVPQGDFFVRELPKPRWEHPILNGVEKICEIHRLREVVALLGFSRFEPITTGIAGEFDLNVRIAPIARDYKWVPTIENRGEGVFIRVSADAINRWMDKPRVQERDKRLRESYDQWQSEHPSPSATGMPGLPYVMLHSLSHLLLTTICLECGYPLSALRERVYAPDGSGALMDQYGILIYTASSGAEGTLGGLVHSARDIRKHLLRALEHGKLCSNDPVCSTRGGQRGGVDRIAGSACHGCLYISETSCERFNQYLDRALVVSTIERCGCEFFDV